MALSVSSVEKYLREGVLACDAHIVPVKDFLDTLIAGNSVPARSGCQAGLRRVVLASHLCR
jgi:hypothetical protein